jgi:ABC-type dipeptide/oligopeptide/nickel transport system permease component
MSAKGTIARRTGRTGVVLLVVYAITFVCIRLTPGNPFAARAPRALSPDQQARLERQFGLDDPWPVQFVRYLFKALRGDFGVSYAHQGEDVVDVIFARAWPTMSLVGAALLVGLVVGVPLGVAAALRNDSWFDHLLSGVSTLGVAIPVFVATPVLVILLSVYAGWLPAQGWDGLISTTAIIPIVVLALEPIAVTARFTRASMIEVLRSDHHRTARARGLARRTVVFRFALRNGLVPVTTITGLQVAGLLGSVVLVESAYNVPGLGKEFLAAITARDYPVVMAATLIFAAVIVVANLLVDVAYARLDPRVGSA